jgi:hypothetical protein
VRWLAREWVRSLGGLYGTALSAARRFSRACGGGTWTGPFAYADGSLHVLSADLVRVVFSGEAATELAGSWGSTTGSSGHGASCRRAWCHEDVGIGQLVFHESAMHGLNTTFFALRSDRARQMAALKRWLHFPPSMLRTGLHPENISADVVVAHNVRHEAFLGVLSEAYKRTRGSVENGKGRFECGTCQQQWGWARAQLRARGGAVSGVATRTLRCCEK